MLYERIHKNILRWSKLKKNSKKLLIILFVLCLCVGGCAIYVSDYYHTDTAAVEAFAANADVPTTIIDRGVIAYGDTDAKVGLIFYPGGKVEYTAYEPLMRQLAQEGVLCILVQMPFNLAVLDINAASGLQEQFPAVCNWYIGGHSLGGTMAASYLGEHTEDFCGLILLGSYISNDLSQTSLRAISIFGSEDGVMNREKYDECKGNLPLDLTEIELAGGCHAYFGMYGEQKGDGSPTLTAEEQIRLTANHIVQAIMRGEN